MANSKKIITKSLTKIEPIEIPIRLKLFIEINTDSGKNEVLPKSATNDLALNDEEDNIAIEIKTIILAVIHNRSIKPRELSPDFDLKDDLGYDDTTLDFLHIALNNYVDHKKRGAKISQSEMDECTTVGTCILLVKNKI